MKRLNVEGFLKHINIDAKKNGGVFIASFDDFPNIPLKSEPIELDFYVFSLEYDVDASFEERFPLVIDYSCYVYYDQPGSILEWNLNVLCKGFFLLISKDLFGRFVDKDSFVNHHKNRVYLNKDEKSSLLDIFQMADQEYKKGNYSKEIMASYAFLLLTHIKDFYKRYAEGKNMKHHKYVDGFNRLLKEYYENERTVESLPTVSFFAEQLNLSANHFSDVIREHTGISPKEHINKQIIRMAKQRLARGEHSISEIARGLGFTYHTYFTRFFKSRTGITPTIFKKQ